MQAMRTQIPCPAHCGTKLIERTNGLWCPKHRSWVWLNQRGHLDLWKQIR